MSFNMSMLVIDPRRVATEVKTPIVAWDGQQRSGTEKWDGKIEKRTVAPQVVLRRLLDNGGTAVIRLNIGNSATNSKGKRVNTGIIMSSNKSVNLDWNEYYALREAIDEGVTKLIAEHASIFEEVARKAQEKMARKAQEKLNKASRKVESAEEQAASDDTPGDDEAPGNNFGEL